MRQPLSVVDHQHLFEESPDGFFSLNEQWEFTHVNKEFERLMKRNRQEFIGRNIWEIMPDIQESSLAIHFNDAMIEKQAVHFETYYSAAGIWLSVNAYPAKKRNRCLFC